MCLSIDMFTSNVHIDIVLDQTFVNPLHGLLNCEIGVLDYHFITTEYRICVHCIHMQHLLCDALVHVIYSGVFGKCSHKIPAC